ncbi:alpha/beta hydrolase [Actinorhabdospora filicis]|uniref:Alpha/beta hydrolase n=1 Tax=Actinorhabdospora filicis TaxID=1785913 RepID=A0A9W6WAT3_9ACTN|nr:alpha/beta hydrolase [Actinorhabdospora filicis]GLZ77975.1 alpha/beta hydrolase [Actinorhabdospora filicis]
MYEKADTGRRRGPRRTILALLTAALLAVVAMVGTTASAGGNRDKPAVLLVHGAFADASSWTGVAERLRRDGYPVTIAAVPLRGLAYDTAYIKGVIKEMPAKTIVVGHSYGGAVITNAAAGEPNVAALVYVAAFAPDKDETVGGLDKKYGGPATKITIPHQYPLPAGTAPGTDYGVELTIKSEEFRRNFAQDVDASEAAIMAAGQRPISVAAFGEPSGTPAWREVPGWYLVAADDRMIPAPGQREMARRMNATVVERSGSHAISVSRPGVVAAVIEDAARHIRH